LVEVAGRRRQVSPVYTVPAVVDVPIARDVRATYNEQTLTFTWGVEPPATGSRVYEPGASAFSRTGPGSVGPPPPSPPPPPVLTQPVFTTPTVFGTERCLIVRAIRTIGSVTIE